MKRATILAASAIEKSLATFVLREMRVRTANDPEDVHKMRVATRRMRAHVRFFRPWLGGSIAELESELKWIASLLGKVRDLEVLWAELETLPDVPEGLSACWKVLHSRHRKNLLLAFKSGRLENFEHHVDQVLVQLRHDRSENAHPLEKRMRMLLREARKAVALATETGHPEAWHDFRIRVKRIRYGLEAIKPLDPKPIGKAIVKLTELQDKVGRHQDLCFFSEWSNSHSPWDSQQLQDRWDAEARVLRGWLATNAADQLECAMRSVKKWR